MEVERGSTVLFAELLGAAELTVRAGDSAAQSAIQRCAGLLVKAAATCDARLVKITGSRVMLVAATTEAGLAAAAAMQSAAEQFSKTADTTLGLGVGLHFGPLLREKGDLFGDTVNFAARMVEQAARGQIVFDAETASALGPFYRGTELLLYTWQGLSGYYTYVISKNLKEYLLIIALAIGAGLLVEYELILRFGLLGAAIGSCFSYCLLWVIVESSSRRLTRQPVHVEAH